MINRFTRRRILNLGLTLLCLVGLWAWMSVRERALLDTAFATGYVLIAAVGFLALYNLRKKLPFLPLGSSTSWLQWHIYVGMGSIGVFALHAGAAWPDGVLESALAIAYLLTVGSGMLGLYLTRTIPPQLARVGRQVIYERIPALRHEIWRRADEVVLAAVAASGATTLAEFYATRLYDFIARPRRLAYQLRPTSAPRKALLGELQSVRRYLSEQEQGPCEELFGLIRQKDDLDFHEARQKLLKMWLFAHLCLTCALVLLALLHALLAHAFHGGAA
jgi:hypothetical protein